MKHYKVISLSVGGPGNQIFHSGQVVTEDHFLKGEADELVKQKYLKEIEIDKKTIVVDAPPPFLKEDLMPEISKASAEDKPEQATVEEIEGPNEKAAKLLAKKE
jgi:hypothetical protein